MNNEKLSQILAVAFKNTIEKVWIVLWWFENNQLDLNFYGFSVFWKILGSSRFRFSDNWQIAGEYGAERSLPTGFVFDRI